jgi:uncharacterized protein (UPF0332 family)
MKSFLSFTKTHLIKRQTPDEYTAKQLAQESLDRFLVAKALFNLQKPKYALENAYEAARELIDAVLFLDGYKSYSHEASITYLIELGFSLTEAMHMDRLRKKRNDVKYYGMGAEQGEAKEALTLVKQTMYKLLKKKPLLKP